MTRIAAVVCVLVLLGFVASCGRPSHSSRGFVFPGGDSVRGKTAFVEMKCHTCHHVDGETDLPGPIVEPALVIRLGGNVSRTRTYGDLVTSIIHPTYTISEQVSGPRRWDVKQSPMPTVNDTMTVQQLLDIVAFLQPRYHSLEPLYYDQYYTP